jgi:hypothetical protein
MEEDIVSVRESLITHTSMFLVSVVSLNNSIILRKIACLNACSNYLGKIGCCLLMIIREHLKYGFFFKGEKSKSKEGAKI